MDDNVDFAGNNSLSDFFKQCELPKSVFDCINVSQFEEFGKESFGAFDLNDADFGRESLGLLHDDCGRESMGILNLSSLDITRPSLGISNLKDIFLHHAITPEQDPFNNLPKKSNNGLENVTPKRLSDYFTPPRTFQRVETLRAKPLGQVHSPSLGTILPSVQLFNANNVSSPTPNKSKQNEPIKVDDEIKIIEAGHISWRLSNGSQIGDDMLDTTQEPEDFANVIMEEDEPPEKRDTETVFKNVDKLFSTLVEPKPENNDLKLETTIASESSDKTSNSKQAIKLIRRLSEILEKAVSSPTQKDEGQNLLTNLAEMCRSKSFSLDFSTHSFGSEQNVERTTSSECWDLRKTSSHGDMKDLPLDLSVKSKSGTEKNTPSPRILPSKLNKVRCSLSANSIANWSVSSNESKKSLDLNLRTRIPDKKLVAKKGPMKAVIPLNNMAKIGDKLKPAPNGPHSKTSKKTPTKSIGMKPMAQSTPETQKCPVSPLSRPKSLLQTKQTLPTQKLNPTDSKPPLIKNDGEKVASRRSAGELRKAPNPTKPIIRSYSSGVLRKCDSNVIGSGSVAKESKVRTLKRPSLLKKVGKENTTK